MKNFKLKIIAVLIIVISIITVIANAQTRTNVKEKVIKIKTSSVCGMCKESIEKALAYEPGIKSSDLDVKTKILTVTYNSEKITPEKIRISISNVGYDADSVKANPKAYQKLLPCCKK